MYRLNKEQWPQKDPITGREICHACWNNNHYPVKNAEGTECGGCGNIHNTWGVIQCDHFKKGDIRQSCQCKFECDCIHLSEQTFADEEAKARKDARKERRKLMREQLESLDNPLQVKNQ